MNILKRVILLSCLSYFATTFFTSCNNGGGAFNDAQAGANRLIGVWKLEATKISPGGQVDWSEVNSKNQYTFNKDGSFSFLNADNNSFSRSGTYELEDNELVLNYSREGETLKGTYYLNFDEGKLILELKACIEECKERYRRKD